MTDPSAELDVTWHHDRLHAVLPIDRDRSLPWFALLPFAPLTWYGDHAFAGFALLVLPLVFQDRRRATLRIDRDHVTVERWHLGRARRVRIPLLQLTVSTGDFAEQLCLCGAGEEVEVHWNGSRESLVWLVDQLERAKEAALPTEAPSPPSELAHLRRIGSVGPRAGEDHFRM